MSPYDPLPGLRREGASLTQVVLGVLGTLYALLTAQMAGFLAWTDISGNRAFTSGGQVYDSAGRRITGWTAMWHQYAPLGWAVLAVALLVGIAWMWRAIGTRRIPMGWFVLAGVGALATMFWLLNEGRFSS